MRRIESFVAGLVFFVPTVCAAVDTASNVAGPFNVEIKQAVIAPAQGYGSNSVQSSFAIKITNTSSDPMRMALMGKLILQLEGDGTTFNDMIVLRGLANCPSLSLQDCERSVDEFEVLGPGNRAVVSVVLKATAEHRKIERVRSAWVSGSLFVKNQTTAKSWKINISVEGIPVVFDFP